jgi:preprotein translocase subunit SecG
MIEILQWTTLIASGAAALSRIPNLVRRKNRSIFYALALLTLATLLSIRGPYLAIDALLGGTNVANLLLRFIIFGAIFFLALRIAAGFGDSRGVQLVRGRAGMLALGLISAVLVVCFVLMDTSGSSAGLVDVAARNQQNALLVEYYGAAGRAYPAYVCLAILPGMLRAIRSPLPVLLRMSAALLAVGSIAIPLSLLFPVVPPGLGFLRFVVNYTAILCFVAGLALIWVASARAGRKHGRVSAQRR